MHERPMHVVKVHTCPKVLIKVIFAVYVCDYERILSFYHSIGSPIDGAHPGPKTDRDNRGRYCP